MPGQKFGVAATTTTTTTLKLLNHQGMKNLSWGLLSFFRNYVIPIGEWEVL